MRLATVAVLSLAVAAGCGGGGDSADTESSGAGETQTEAQARTTGSDDEIEARGTVQAFVVAASEEDVETFCGLVTQSYRDQIELAHRAVRQVLRPAAAVRA